MPLPSPEPGPRAALTLLPPLAPRHSPLALWHLLSLDAPTVAALWAVFLARWCGLTLPWTEPAAMFVAVWMLYAADRLLDARLLDATPHCPLPNRLEARHFFHHRHRDRFLPVIALSSFVLAWLLHRIDPRSLHLFALLAALLAAWLLLIHTRPQAHRLPKEFAVGLFFAVAVCVPTLAHFPQRERHLLPVAALFAAVCILNCLYLYAWEHPHARSRDPSHAHATTRWATGHLGLLSTAVVAAGLLLHSAPALACALSGVLLLTLHNSRHRVSPVHLRAAADLALLTPLLFPPFL